MVNDNITYHEIATSGRLNHTSMSLDSAIATLQLFKGAHRAARLGWDNGHYITVPKNITENGNVIEYIDGICREFDYTFVDDAIAHDWYDYDAEDHEGDPEYASN